MRRTFGIAAALVVLSTMALRARTTPGDEPGSAGGERPAEITQAWPPHRDGAALPVGDATDTDPNCPTGGRMWRWQVVPRRPAVANPTRGPAAAAGAPSGPACRLRLVATREADGRWLDDTTVHPAGELMTSQQTRDGRDFWESDSAQATWWTTHCARALPESGFTFGVSLTKKEWARATIRRVRFELSGAASDAQGSPLSIDVWTDPFGARRTVPLTAPMTTVGLTPRIDGVSVGPPDVGLHGIVLVPGARAVIEVRDATGAGKPLAIYTSLERDFEGDDPSPSGLRATRATLPESWRGRVKTTATTLDAEGTGSFTIATPDDKAVVGFSFYVQAGVGADATAGLSCALACTGVASLTDYDGDGRPNAKDPAPLDPKR